MSSKNLTTKTTIENLAAELKKRFTATDTSLKAAQAQIALAFKSGKVDGNTVTFYTSSDKTGDPVFTLDFPTEMFLDQTKTTFVPSFSFADGSYMGATDPKMDGKPVMVLAVKGEGKTASVTYSFLDMAALVDTYKAKTDGKDKSTTITVSGYEIDVKVNISTDANNALTLGSDGGLFVPEAEEQDVSGKADKKVPAASGNLAGLDESGNLTDSGIAGAKVLTEDDIKDYTAEEIAALLGDAD